MKREIQSLDRGKIKWVKAANIRDLATGRAFERFSFSGLEGAPFNCVVRRDRATIPNLLLGELALAGATMPPLDEQAEQVRDLIESPAEANEVALARLGWTEDGLSFATAYEVLGQVDAGESKLVPPLNRNVAQNADAGPAGTLADWQRLVAIPASNSSRMMLFMAAAFAAPLLKISGLDPFHIRLHGPSKIGRSAALGAAASVSGDGSADTRAEAQFRDRKGPKRSDLLRILADNVEHDLHSREITVSEGEKPKAQLATEAGMSRPAGDNACVLDLPALRKRHQTVIDMMPRSQSAGFGPKRLAALLQSIREGTQQAHGVALKPYLCFLFERPVTKAKLDKLMSKILLELDKIAGKRPVLRHMARNLALVYAGGRLAIEAGVLPWAPKKLRRAIFRCFQDAMAGAHIPETAGLTPREHLQTMLDGLRFPDPAGEKWTLSACGRVARRWKDGAMIYRIQKECFEASLQPVRARNCLRWLLAEERLVQGKTPYVVDAGIDWAFRSLPWQPINQRFPSLELRWS